MAIKKRLNPEQQRRLIKWPVAPLKGSFMLLAILGFLISAYLVNNPAWRLAFLIVFVAMFVASLISMSKAKVIPEK